MTDAILQTLAGSGIMGVVAVVALQALRAKDKALSEEMRFRIEDANKFNTQSLTLQRETMGAVEKLSAIAEAYQQRDQGLAQREQALAQRELQAQQRELVLQQREADLERVQPTRGRLPSYSDRRGGGGSGP